MRPISPDFEKNSTSRQNFIIIFSRQPKIQINFFFPSFHIRSFGQIWLNHFPDDSHLSYITKLEKETLAGIPVQGEPPAPLVPSPSQRKASLRANEEMLNLDSVTLIQSLFGISFFIFVFFFGLSSAPQIFALCGYIEIFLGVKIRKTLLKICQTFRTIFFF